MKRIPQHIRRLMALSLVSCLLLAALGPLSAKAEDISKHWAVESINYLRSRGIVQGDSQGNINPDKNITRAEFVTVVNRAFGLIAQSDTNFTDVNPGDWYYTEFAIARKTGYILGDAKGNANPNRNITRAEVAVCLNRILELPKASSPNAFLDRAAFPDWSLGAIDSMTENGYINGYKDNTFRAQNNITRAEAFTILARILKDLPAVEPPDHGAVDIGIVLPTKDEPRWLMVEAKFKEVIGDTSYKCEVLFSQGDPAIEKTNVEALIHKGIKVLIICPYDSSAAAAAAEAARAAGVKVISYDRLISNTDAVDYYVTFDSIEVGEAQGRYLADQATGKDNPLYLYAGNIADNNAFLFFQGAWNMLQSKIADGTFKIMNSSRAEELKGKKDLSRDEQHEIIAQIHTYWDPDHAKKLAQDNITAFPPPTGVPVYLLGPNDGTARAVADVFASAGVGTYYITGQDAEVDSVQYIIDGKQSMTVFKDNRTLATDAVNLAVTLLEGGTPQTIKSYFNGNIDVPARPTAVVVVTKDNVKAALIDSGYYSASDFTGL